MGSPRRAVALCCILAMLASACASITRPLTEAASPTTTETPEGLPSSEGDEDTSAVSFEEYTSALDDLSRCMVESGAALSGRVLDPITGLYLYDYDPAYDQVHSECYATHFQVVDELYRASPRRDVLAGEFDDTTATDGLPEDLPEDSWIRLLATVPDASETRFNPITIVDLARARDVLDITLPGDGAPDARVDTYLSELSDDAGLLPIGPMAAFGRVVTPAEMRLEVGFDHRAWDQIVEAGSADRHHLAIAGRFDADLVLDAITRDVAWNDLLDANDYEGITVYGWGTDGGLDLERQTPVRSIGEYRRIALVDRYVIWTRFSDAIEAGIDAVLGLRRTLADVPELRRLAAIADEEELLSGHMTMRVTPYVGYADNGRIETVLLQQPLALMFGDGRDRRGDFMSIHLLYASPELAEENLDEFETRVADAAATTVGEDVFITLRDPRRYEIELQDDVLRARIWKSTDRLPPPLTMIRFS